MLIMIIEASATQTYFTTFTTPVQYNMAKLHDIRSTATLRRPTVDLPSEIKIRKRGRKGDLRKRTKRRGFKPHLATTIIGNVPSMNNKLDELRANVQHQGHFRTCSIMCFTESWLHDHITDASVSVEGYKLFRADRQKESGKKKREHFLFM